MKIYGVFDQWKELWHFGLKKIIKMFNEDQIFKPKKKKSLKNEKRQTNKKCIT